MVFSSRDKINPSSSSLSTCMHRAVHCSTRGRRSVFATLVVYEIILRSRVPSPAYRTCVLFRGEIRYLVPRSCNSYKLPVSSNSRRLHDVIHVTDLSIRSICLSVCDMKFVSFCDMLWSSPVSTGRCMFTSYWYRRRIFHPYSSHGRRSGIS